jgi:hypothetical protein
MRRIGCLAFILYQALFLNVFVPGHTRGIVQLAGSHAMPCCCGGDDSKQSSNDPQHDPQKNNRAENCAICAFAARITIPPTIDLTLPPHARLGVVRDESPIRIELPALPLHYHGRAPPTVNV